jgi:hypothetical protein
MSDEALRALEREARARPDDRAAAWACARGLERAGERRALWLELCRMARAGDDDASRAVDGWVPGLGGTTPPALASLRAPKVERVSLVRDEALRDDPLLGVVRSADGRVLLRVGQTLLTFDPVTERIEWRQQDVAALCPCGDDALVVTRERSAFVRRGDRSDVVAAGLVGDGAVEDALTWGDRAIVHRADDSTQVFDLGDGFGRLLWQASRVTCLAVTQDCVFLLESDDCSTVDARDLDTGAQRWRRELRLEPEAPFLWRSDPRGAITSERLHGVSMLTHLDARTGATVWSVSLRRPAESVLALTADVVAVLHGYEHLCLWSRRDGRVLWTTTIYPSATGSVGAADDDALYVATLIGERLDLTVYELKTGATRATVSARLPGLSGGLGVIDPLSRRSGGLDAVVTSGDRAWLVRFAD